MRILFVHGIAQGGKNPADWEHTWVETLKNGYEAAKLPFPNDLKIDFPFYGDALDKRVANLALPPPAEMVAKGDSGNTAYEEFFTASLKEMQVNVGITQEEVALEAGPIAATKKGAQNWLLTLALARLLNRRATPFVSFSIENFLRDVYLYTSDQNASREINGIVAQKLTDEPTVLVAHSLGTVVSYRVLQEQNKRVNLRRFITVGSPLGIKAITRKLGVIHYPKAELLWYNAFDKKDIVALAPLSPPYFKTDPAIENYGGVQNQTDNRHGIIGYLNDVEVAKKIAEALTHK